MIVAIVVVANMVVVILVVGCDGTREIVIMVAVML